MLINYFIISAVILFIMGLTYKILRLALVPSNLRFELVPEGELSDDENSKRGFFAIFIDEFIFQKSLWNENRKIWGASFALHISLYLTFIDIIYLILMNYVFGLNNGEYIYNIIPFISSLFLIQSIIASILGPFAAIFLIYFKSQQKDRVTFIKSTFLYVFLIFYFFSLFAWIIVDKNYVTNFASVIFYIDTFIKIPGFNIFSSIHLILLTLLILILPFGGVSHFLFYFFKFKKIEIKDFENLNPENLHKRLSTEIEQDILWINPHINFKGKRTWIGTFKK